MSRREAFVRWMFDDVWSQGETKSLGSRLGRVTFHYGGDSRATDGDELGALIDRWRGGLP